MTAAAWFLVALFVYLALGGFVTSGFRDRPARKRTPLETVRDRQLDIKPALDRGRR